MIGINYWWVNHKQTFRAEIEGGYIWSPKKNKNGSKNQTYLNLPKTKPGDMVFSFAGAKISAIGIVSASCREQVKPEEFGQAGKNWKEGGWAVPISWTMLENPIRPKDHAESIAPLLPETHSPIRADGNGNQGCYLAKISKELAELILDLANDEDLSATVGLEETTDEIEEDEIEAEIEASDEEPTTKEQLVSSRRGQGKFKKRVAKRERSCRVTGETNKSLLIASHIKPWKVSSNSERLDGDNGLLLAPHVDKLFDRGLISFSDSGDLLFYQKGVGETLDRWRIPKELNVGKFRDPVKKYLAFHRREVFKGEAPEK